MRRMIYLYICMLALFSVKADNTYNVMFSNKYYIYANETLHQIDKDLSVPETNSYYETQDRNRLSYIWGNIFLLYAYDELCRYDLDEGKENLEKCFNVFNKHWCKDYNGIPGYNNVQIVSDYIPDRYYDENGWTSIGLSEAYKYTKVEEYKRKAIASLNFSLSGEDSVCGGGIYFKERFHDFEPQKNTICSAVAMLACMNLYEITNKEIYLNDAKRLSEWTVNNLYDKESKLFWDAITVKNKKIIKDTWSYNAGFMIRSWLKMFQATNDNYYLEIARKTMEAAENKWLDSETGALKDPGYFAFTIIDCFFDFFDFSKESIWLQKAFLCVDYIHDSLKDNNGRYPEYWDGRNKLPVKKYQLMHESVVAYIYMRAANYYKYIK